MVSNSQQPTTANWSASVFSKLWQRQLASSVKLPLSGRASSDHGKQDSSSLKKVVISSCRSFFGTKRCFIFGDYFWWLFALHFPPLRLLKSKRPKWAIRGESLKAERWLWSVPPTVGKAFICFCNLNEYEWKNWNGWGFLEWKHFLTFFGENEDKRLFRCCRSRFSVVGKECTL